MSHTPTPWRVGINDGAIVADKPESPIDARGGEELMKAYGGYVVCESCTPEDARFIVEACNAHERLLEAANQALEALDIHPAKTNGFAPRQSKIRAAAKRKLRDAIALCEEGGK